MSCLDSLLRSVRGSNGKVCANRDEDSLIACSPRDYAARACAGAVQRRRGLNATGRSHSQGAAAAGALC